jgi:drug/metabolite transporter (DMT)-like permease
MKQSSKALLEINTATALLGFVAIFPKVIPLSPLGIIFGRCLVAALALGLLLLFQRRAPRLGGVREYAIVALLGILLSTHWVTYFHAVQVSSVAVGILALFTFPVITVLLEPLAFSARIRLADVLTAGAVFLGIALIIPDYSLESSVARGVFWGVTSALLYSLRNIFQKKYLAGVPGSDAMLFQVLAGTIVFLPFLPADFEHQWPDHAGKIILLGVVFTAFPHTLIVQSLSRIKAKTVGIVQSLQPAYGVLLAAIFLSEIPSLRTVLGGVVIMGAAIYEGLKVSREGL